MTKLDPRRTQKKSRTVYAIHPWECRHHQYHSDILAYVEASGEWEVIAVIRPSSGLGAEAMATYITDLINDTRQNHNILQAARDALEACLEEDGLTFSSEQTVDRVMARLKKHCP